MKNGCLWINKPEPENFGVSPSVKLNGKLNWKCYNNKTWRGKKHSNYYQQECHRKNKKKKNFPPGKTAAARN